MFPNDNRMMYSIWSAQDDRDLSRAAAERYFLLQAAAERRSSSPPRSRLRRLLTATGPSAVATRRAEA